MVNNGRRSVPGLVGVGIDLVNISVIKDLDERTHHSFTERTFTAGEKKEAERSPVPYEYYAGRYAVKEAVFKAIMFRCTEPFDFRIVETLSEADGRPYVVMSPEFRKICEDADVDCILISISHDGDLAVAIAEAVKDS